MATVTRTRLARVVLTPKQWGFLSLLVLSICISYVDRGSLSVADRYLQTEFSLNPEQRGRVYSAFFWSYAPALVLAGWLVDRFNVNRVLGAGYVIWSVATLMTGAVHGFAMLFLLRLLLGLGESVAYPAYSKILAAESAGASAGLRERGDRCGQQAGAGAGRAGGRPADGSLRMARVLLCDRHAEPAVADPVVDLGTERSRAAEDGSDWRSGETARLWRNPFEESRVGHVYRGCFAGTTSGISSLRGCLRISAMRCITRRVRWRFSGPHRCLYWQLRR